MNIEPEIDDGGLRFSEEKYYQQTDSDREESDIANVTEDCDDYKEEAKAILKRGTAIFIPILDGLCQHWFLAVVRFVGDCEIWDSKPEVASQQRRKDYVESVVDLLLSVFAAELKQSPWVCSEAASFTYFYPAICTTEVNDYDSGVCVIRNM
ncbi:hypothetical protein ACLB2K_022213 [Fragaria x ananassa]